MPLLSRGMRIWLGGATFVAVGAAATIASGRRHLSRRAAESSPSGWTSGMAAEAHNTMMLGDVRDAPAGRENDLQAIELARFAVAEHNSKTNAMLEFERLVKVRHQVVSGSMHYFTVEVKEGGGKKLYEAKVWEKVWENFKQLQSFEPVEDA